MRPFRDNDLRSVLETQSSKLKERIEAFSNDEIMANNLELLADNCYEEFYIEPITIGNEEVSRRKISQVKVEWGKSPFWHEMRGYEYETVDGMAMEFSYPYSGEQELFTCRASTYLSSIYPEIGLDKEFIVFRYDIPFSKIKTDQDKEQIYKLLENDLASIKNGISFINTDIKKFNQSLRQSALTQLQKRKQQIELFYSAVKFFEIPVEKTAYASAHIPVQRKIKPISRQYKDEPNYCISDAEYLDIISTIKHNGSTYERTPTSLKCLHEEDIRNLLLSSLNGTYQGNATGETFRKNGKTDICIEWDNRAAFVAECKIWKGQGKVNEAISQLDSYLTWRDCKTALIYFVRNKGFLPVVDTMKQTLENLPNMRQVKEIDRNEFECSYNSQENPGQIVKIRVLLFDLYAE